MQGILGAAASALLQVYASLPVKARGFFWTPEQAAGLDSRDEDLAPLAEPW